MPDYVPFGARWIIAAVNFILALLIGGPPGEEFGWRNVVLPALEARFNPPRDSLIPGIMLTLWQLPFFFISTSAQHSLHFFCILIMRLYHGSGEILLLVMLFHAAVNTCFRQGLYITSTVTILKAECCPDVDTVIIQQTAVIKPLSKGYGCCIARFRKAEP